MSKQVRYFISTGDKQDYYTLWREITFDLRPTDASGNSYIPAHNPINRFW